MNGAAEDEHRVVAERVRRRAGLRRQQPAVELGAARVDRLGEDAGAGVALVDDREDSHPGSLAPRPGCPSACQADRRRPPTLFEPGKGGRRMERCRLPASAAACSGSLAVALVTAGNAAAATAPREPFFPHAGSRAYDVVHYDVNLAYRPASGDARGDDDDRSRRHAAPAALLPRPRRPDRHPRHRRRQAAEFGRGKDKLKITPKTPPRARRDGSRSSSTTAGTRAG